MRFLTTQLPNAALRLPWYRQLLARFLVLWPLKALGTTSFMALFFWVYFSILQHLVRVPTVMPKVWLDQSIPFSLSAFPVYLSLWVYVSLPPAFLGSLRSLLWFGLWICGLCLFCLGIFWFFPTVVPLAGIDWAAYPQMALIKNVDAAGNACPSLHVASSVFAALWLDRICVSVKAPRAWRWCSGLFCLAILWSTVAIRQHVVLDVVAGVAAGLLFAIPSLRHGQRFAGSEI